MSKLAHTIADELTNLPAHFPPSPLSRPLHRLVHYGDRLNLDQRLGGVEGRDLDDRVGRIRRREVATPKLDDLRKVRHIPKENRHLDDVREA